MKAKVKDDKVLRIPSLNLSTTVEMKLQVPRGLIAFLEDLHRLGNEEPKEYLEKCVLAKELECLIGHIPEDLFDVKSIRIKYGEGSDLSNWE